MPLGPPLVRGPTRWWIDGKSLPLLDRLIDDPDAVLLGAGSVAREVAGRKRLYRVADPGGGPALYVKVFHTARGLPRLRSSLRHSRARREARVASAVRDRGFDAATPIAVGEERRHGWLRRSFSVSVERPARDLRAVLLDPALVESRRRRILEELGRLNRALHDAGVDQEDTAPNNFLVDAEDRLVLIDFERCGVGEPLPAARRHFLLAKLHRWELGVSRANRLRLLRAYLGPGTGRAERRAAWEAIWHRYLSLRRHDARRAGRAAFQPGRHLERQGEVWTVRRRASAPARRLELLDAQARLAWRRAYQLERLGLPALRAVRMGPGWIELEDPGPEPGDAGRARAIESATRRIRVHGELSADAPWILTASGARLADPRAFTPY